MLLKEYCTLFVPWELEGVKRMNSRNIPVIALRGMTVLPGMMIHFDISRDITKRSVEKAMLADQMVFLAAQKNPDIESPEYDDLYNVGCIALVKQLIKLPGDIYRVLVSGLQRGYLDQLLDNPNHLDGMIVPIEDESILELSDYEKEAMLRSLHDLLEVYATENTKLSKESFRKLINIEEIESLVTQVSITIPLTEAQKQALLEIDNLVDCYQRLAVIISEEIEVLRIRKELQSKVKEKVDRHQKEYLLREQLKVIREELGETNAAADADNYEEEAKKLQCPEFIREKVLKEIERFRNISGNSAEGAVARGYIETLLELPWEKVSKDRLDLKYAEKILNAQHYGMEKVKTRILEFLAVRQLSNKGQSPIICLVGPPGTGKTSIARSVAEALDKEYVRISLGGVRDEAEIRGHRRTYVGAMPGRIINGLKQAGVKNPLMLLDEIDKVSSDYKGDTSAALLEVLDPEQNNKFVDHYIELPVDLSEVLFITTANSVQDIPRPLLDRMELIEVSSYTQNEKVHIAKNHLIEKQKQKNGLEKKQLSISEKALNTIITGYTRESGVRNLERTIGAICRKAAKEILTDGKATVKITEKNLEKYLGKTKYNFDMANQSNEIGIVRGLAWTSVGGDTLQIEVNVMPGKGIFELTGQLGDVMKESAKTGISYIRSVGTEYGIDKKFFEEHDIHIHIPEGAVPKDGPSAGITMATAMMSAILKREVRCDVAMTGEITLRGRVLPIGGLKEKVLAAKNAGIKLVLVPAKNRKDIEELSEEIVSGIDIKFVDMMQEVIKYAFVATVQPTK